MSSFSRRLFLTGSAALLVGCGFEPALAPGGAQLAFRGRLKPRDPKTRNDFLFVKAVEERLGVAPEGALALSYTITTRSVGLAVTQAQVTTRFNLLGDLAFTVRAADGRVLTSGEVDSFTSYSTTGTTVATISAERDAHERLVVILADQMIARLTATSKDWAA